MTADSSDPQARPASRARFATTQWSVVLAAGHDSSPESAAAIESLCQTYWYPLYAYVRRQGHQAVEAQDLTQAFFTRLLEKDYLQAADRQRGRFRTFLLTIFKRFLANDYQRTAAQKRGGGRQILSFNFDDGERRLQMEPAHQWTPERIYERRWALTLLDEVLTQLGDDYASKGKGTLFDRLRGVLAGGEPTDSYADIAAQLGMSEGAVKVAVHRLRQRYRDMLRRQIRNTVADEDEIDDELAHLLAAVRSDD